MACYLADQPGYDVVVAMDRPETYRNEAVESLMPFRGRLIDRQSWSARKALKDFAADLVIIDNHVPKRKIAPRMLVLWHGFGWRIDDLSTMRREMRKHVGDVSSPNSAFRWVAFGQWDRDYRVNHSQIASENVWTLGSAYSDLLRPEGLLSEQFSRQAMQKHYPIDLSRKLVTLGFTWHHGGALGHWGDDAALTEALLGTIGGFGANALIRMHDRHRYDASYVQTLTALAQRHPHVLLKFKSDQPDSLVDLLLSDVLVSNYSSLLNPFYHTLKPTIHVDPSDAPGDNHVSRVLKRGKVHITRIDDPTSSWKLSPESIGGLRARSYDELCGHIETSLAQPTCCTELSQSFCRTFATVSDGNTRASIRTHIDRWLES